MGLSISAEDITALETRTEGWIAGLQMAAISLQRRKDTADFIRAFSGSHHFVLDYLMKEVIDRQPEGIRDFLLKTSILQRLCGPLCEAVLGIPSGSGQKLLEELELANLFIIPLDNQRHWYRYHHLFGELLRHRFMQNSSTGEITALHVRASEWYEANQMAFEAFQHAVAANDVPRAERLVESKEMALHLRTVALPVLDWLNSLPNDVRDASPRLWVRAATLALMAGRTSTVQQAIAGAEAALQNAIPDAETRDLIGQIACAKATYAFFHYDFETMLAEAHRALEYLDPGNMAFQFTANWALANALRVSGKRSDANRATQDCLAISQKSPSMFSKILAVMNLAVLQEMNNQFFQAAESYKQAIEISGDHPQPNMAEAHFGLARIYYEWNDLKSAEEQDQTGLQMARIFDQEVDRFIVNEVFLARLRLAQGDLAGAAGMLAQSERTAQEKKYVLRFADIAELQILILLQQSNLAAAAELAGRYDLPLSRSRVLLAQGDAPAALAILEPLLKQAKEKGWVDKQLNAMLLQALALSANHEKDKALRILEEVLTMTEPGGFVRTFLDEGEPMAELLSEARAQGIRSDYLTKLLAAFVNEKLKAENKPFTPEPPSLIAPLSSRELEILQLIAQGLSNREICDRLFLALSTVKGHIRVTFDKLQVQRRTEAIARARELGLL
jgi:ATP-dependent transcriptional regulator